MPETIHQEIALRASPKQVYEAYMDNAKHAAFTGDKTKMTRKEGQRFRAGGTFISGFNLELVPGKRIVQAWRGNNWPEGAWSVLRLELRASGKGTKLVMDHAGVPASYRREIAAGWHEYYWRPLQAYFRGPSR